MTAADKDMKIKIIKNGPYIVSGKVPLTEQIIESRGKGYVFKDGLEYPPAQVYSLCRCGQSKKAPFCDGAHEKALFDGEETASRKKYEVRAELIEGPDLNLWDDNRCALARFCNRNTGTAWQLVRSSDDPELREEAVRAAVECPAGRLEVSDKEGRLIEPQFEPSISIIQDPEKGVSSGIYVKGNIPIESQDGHIYEVRNRVMLCRCGKSRNKPFCDATHVPAHFFDKR